jgi:hypothetical protein
MTLQYRLPYPIPELGAEIGDFILHRPHCAEFPYAVIRMIPAARAAAITSVSGAGLPPHPQPQQRPQRRRVPYLRVEE